MMNIFTLSAPDNTDSDSSGNILGSLFIIKCFSHSIIVQENMI